MKTNGVIFIVAFIFALTGGYFWFTANDSSANDNETTNVVEEKTEDAEKQEAKEENDASTENAETVQTDSEALETNNCLSCHAVESLGIEGGTTGPDLSNAYTDVEGKHGKPIDEFLQEPTSAVMSTVIGDNPLADEEREKIIELLKEAAERK